MFPKKGKVFPNSSSSGHPHADLNYAEIIGAVLTADLGHTHRAIKTVIRWTGANERTVKNWFAGTNGPSGVHLIALFRHSDIILNTCLGLAGRERIIADQSLLELRQRLRELLTLLELGIEESQ